MACSKASDVGCATTMSSAGEVPASSRSMQFNEQQHSRAAGDVMGLGRTSIV